MAKKKQPTRLSPDTVDAIRQFSFEANGATPPNHNLDCFAQVKDVFRAVGGEWSSAKGAFLFPVGVQASLLVDSIIALGELPATNPLDFYPTPIPVIDIVMNEAPRPIAREEDDGSNLEARHYLEPNAGDGAIASVLAAHMRPCDSLTLVEIDPIRAAYLRKRFPQATVIEGDFLEFRPVKRFSHIVMNPPFAGRTYEKHVAHAIECLDKSGLLAAVIPSGFHRLNNDFRAVMNKGVQWDLGKAFPGVSIETTIVWIEKSRLSMRESQAHRGYSSFETFGLALAASSSADLYEKTQKWNGDKRPEAPQINGQKLVTAIMAIADVSARDGADIPCDASAAKEVARSLAVDWNLDFLIGSAEPTEVTTDRIIHPVIDVAHSTAEQCLLAL